MEGHSDKRRHRIPTFVTFNSIIMQGTFDESLEAIEDVSRFMFERQKRNRIDERRQQSQNIRLEFAGQRFVLYLQGRI